MRSTGDAHILCNNCRGELEVALQNYQQQKRSEKSRLVPGLVGAFLGSLIGCALWVVIYRLGYIAGIAGAVTAICAMKGYEMLGGHLDRKGVAGSAIIMVVMIYFCQSPCLGLGRLLGAGRLRLGIFRVLPVSGQHSRVLGSDRKLYGRSDHRICADRSVQHPSDCTGLPHQQRRVHG